jgi:hypothetical protein
VPDVEMADVYRSLVANMRDKLGGTINDANADAIAHAAAQVYRREVEPRLWQEKSAHQLLDGFGVPRSGAFVPYSLSDRLLLLRRSDAADPYRAQAHEVLDELGVPRLDDAGREYPLRARLTRLLGSLENPSGEAPAGDDDGGGDEAGLGAVNGRGNEGDPEANGPDGTVAGPELVDALEAIQRAVGPAGEEEPIVEPPPPPPPPPPSAPDLIGLGTLLGGIQEELVEVRQAVESLRQEVRDAVALFQAGGAPGGVPPVAPDLPSADGGPEIVVRRVGGAPDAVAPAAGPAEAGSDSVLRDSGSPDGERQDAGPPDSGPSEAALAAPAPPEASGPDGVPDVATGAGPVGPHEPTRVIPAVPGAPAAGPVVPEERVGEPAVRPRRSRRFVMLVLLVVLIGILLAAGITAAVVLGWDQLQSRFVDTIGVPFWGGPGGAPW